MTKERIAILSSMSAVATFLVGMVLLINFIALERHDHIYDLTLTEENGVYSLYGKCTVDGCEDPEYYETDVSDVEKTGESAATCFAEGETVYSVERFGETVNYTVYHEKLSHTLGGEPIGTLLNPDGSINHDVEGVSLLVGSSYDCGGTVEGYYTCGECEKRLSVMVYKAHVGELCAVSAPTCTEDGIMESHCVNCGDKLATEQKIYALGHEYVYAVEDIAGSDKKNIICACTRDGCGEVEKVESVKLTEKGRTHASCTAKESVTYSYETEGGAVTFTVYGKCAHLLGGEKHYEGSILHKDTVGVEVISGDDGYFVCEVCGEYVRVKLDEK